VVGEFTRRSSGRSTVTVPVLPLTPTLYLSPESYLLNQVFSAPLFQFSPVITALKRSSTPSIITMTVITPDTKDTRTQVVTSPKKFGSSLNISGDFALPYRPPSYHTIICQLDDLKTKNTFNLNDLETLQDEINKHLIKCQDHYLQVTQLKLAHGAGNSPILFCSDKNLVYHYRMRLTLSTTVLEFDIKRAKSLGAFYSAQKKFFRLIDEFKEVEMEIQRLLRGLIEQGDAHEDLHVEMEESEARMVIIEESRVTRREGWLEWLDEFR
jgi:hypothetical protein